MNKAVRTIFDNTDAALSGIHGGVSSVNAASRNHAFAAVLALTPPLLAAFALTEVGKWAVREIGRRVRIRETRPDTPSLRGTPTPGELAADWNNTPRSMGTCLRLGSRLADLDSTLDHSLLRKKLPNGKTVIRSRKGGMKGWLSGHRVPATYSTVMRYKKLAQRLRQVLGLDGRLPLEWVLAGVPSGQALPPGLEAPRDAAARRLAKLLREHPSLAALTREVEKKLGIVRLVTVRKAPFRRGRGGVKKRKDTGFSAISQGRRVCTHPDRVEATKKAILKLLGLRNPGGSTLHLQNRLRHWLSTLAATGFPHGIPPTGPSR